MLCSYYLIKRNVHTHPQRPQACKTNQSSLFRQRPPPKLVINIHFITILQHFRDTNRPDLRNAREYAGVKVTCKTGELSNCLLQNIKSHSMHLFPPGPLHNDEQ